MPYTLQCPRCSHRIFRAWGTCQVTFEGEIDCMAWVPYENGAEVELGWLNPCNATDTEVARIECAHCHKRIEIGEATTAYEEAYQTYLDSLPDPNQLPLFRNQGAS